MNLSKQQINTILKSDTLVFRHKEGKGVIECIQKSTSDSLFEQHVAIEVDSDLHDADLTKACYVEFFYRGEYPRHNNALFFFKSLKKNNDVKLHWDRNSHRTNTHKELNLITETLAIENSGLFMEVITQVSEDNSANMLK